MDSNQSPMVSIIVPVYGVEAYLSRCLDSILAQTYENLQIILVDDGSPDRCPAICDSYGKKDMRVSVLHKKNGGVASARNAGLGLAEGKYVTFCDSDDAYEPDFIQALASAMEDTKADVAGANHRKIYEDGREEATDHETGSYAFDDMEERLKYLIAYVMTDRHAWEVTTRMFRLDLIQSHRIRFSESCHNFAEDLGFLLEYSLYISRAESIETSGYLYFMRGESMMNSSKTRPMLDAVNEVSLQFQKRLNTEAPEQISSRYGPVLHFLIMMNQYSVAIRCSNYHHMETYLSTICRRSQWRELTEKIFSCRPLLETLFGKIPAGRILIFSRYLLGGSWLRFKIERFLFFKWNRYRD